MDPVLAAKYPEIRSYVGKGADNPAQTIYFSVSPLGLQSMLIRPDKPTVFIEPYTKDQEAYVVYAGSGKEKSLTPAECRVLETGKKNLRLNAITANRPNADDGILRTYRLALSCSGEYAQYFGGTVAGAIAGMNATMTRINGIFETDFGVHMNMIANTNRLVYLNPDTDPYTSDYALAWSDYRWLTEVGNTLTRVVGSAAYDVGHLLLGAWSGGVAINYGTVCNDPEDYPYAAKGEAVSCSWNPQGDEYDVHVVAHEFGHQFGAYHVFSHTPDYYPPAQVEPSLGTSIMSYSNGEPMVEGQPAYGAYFNAVSIEHVTNVIKSSTCAVNTATGNAIPTANAGPDYTIPKSTAFILRGSSTDANGDPLTYNWEQQDPEAEGTPYPSSTETSGPAFASLAPSSVPYRSFPTLSTVLAGSVSSTFEVVPSVARSMNFRFTVRDNHVGGPANNSDDLTVFTSATSGPFVVAAPNSAVTWTPGSTQTIAWSVAGTRASPVSCANVKISLSTDGGLTFPTVLIASTPNDGGQSITVPNLPSAACRIKIEAVGNIFYDISNVNFYISGTGVYHITSSVAPILWGTISPNGVTPVVGGSNKTYTITPADAGYNVENVVVDGVSKGAITTYTFTNVTAPHSITAKFKICSPPAAPAAITGQASNLCGGKTITYTASSVPGATFYYWTVPDGFTELSAQGTTTMTIKTPVTFTTAVLQVEAGRTSCGYSTPTSLTLSGPPGDLSAQITGPSQVVAGSTNVYSLPSNLGLTYYSWVADGGSVVGGWGTNSASIKAGAINGYVRVTVKNSCGTAPVAKKYFTVQSGGNCTPPVPAPAAITGQASNLCGVKTLSYTASAVAGATSYNWAVPPGFTLLSGQGTASVSIKTPATFTTAALKVSATTSCGTSPQTNLNLSGAPGDLSAQITGPSQVVTGSVNVYSLPSNLGLTYFSWVADGSSVVGGWGTNNASIKAGAINGYVRATVRNACGTAPVARKFFTVQSAALKVNSANREVDLSGFSFRAYPNPVQDVATVVFDATVKDMRYELRVVDIYGQVLIAKKGVTNAGVNTVQIHLGKYAKGIYMVTLVTGNKIRSQKLFKSN